MESLPLEIIAAIFVAAAGLALVLDQVKLPVMAAFETKTRARTRGGQSNTA